MDKTSKQEKAQQIRDILRLRLIEMRTYTEIITKLKISRPTAIKYINKFLAIVSDEDLAIKDNYKDVRRRVPFPTRWNKYVKCMVDNYARHPKRVATPAMRKKIIQVSATVGMSAIKTFNKLSESKGTIPSYDTVAKVIREYLKKDNPPTDKDNQ
jgi:hypothetical protein